MARAKTKTQIKDKYKMPLKGKKIQNKDKNQMPLNSKHLKNPKNQSY